MRGRTVEGDCEGKKTIGQVHFCDVTASEDSVETKTRGLGDLLPAFDRLAECVGTEDASGDTTTLTSLLTVMAAGRCEV